MAYCSMCSAFFMDLPLPSLVFHSSSLSVKSINLVVAYRWLPLVHNGNHLNIFHSDYLDYMQRCFSNRSWFVLLCNKLKIADRERKWILQFQASSMIIFFIMATLITDILFEQLLICTAVQWGEHSGKRTVMDTSLSDIIVARGIITTLWCRMRGFIKSVNIIVCNKS